MARNTVLKFFSRINDPLALLLYLVFGTAFFLVPACAYVAPVYAAPVHVSVSARVLDAQTTNAISNLRATLLSATTSNVSTSGSDGSIGFFVNGGQAGTYQLTVEDTDGTNNGSYSNQALSVSIPSPDTITNLGNILLDQKTN